MAHQDVVPIEPGTEGDWDQPPFSGALADGYVWGRGTLDTKGKLMAVCEAVDRLAAEGFQSATTRRSAASAAPSRSPNASRRRGPASNGCSTKAA
jgi:acetylornithine deacetylase/succinyl-diaminopimelate desuccinylase-like protein